MRLFLAVSTALTLTGCALFIDAGVDRSHQLDAKAVGYHFGFGAAVTIDPRSKGALAIAASRRVDRASSLPARSIRSDGWELRGDLDLPWANWRLTGFGRRAGIEQIESDDEMTATIGGRVWGAGLGVTRYWPTPWSVMSLTAAPTFSTASLATGDATSYGAELRFTYAFDGFIAVMRACTDECRAELNNYKPRGSSTGSHSWLSPSKPVGTSCYYRSVTDSRGNTKSVWTCP